MNAYRSLAWTAGLLAALIAAPSAVWAQEETAASAGELTAMDIVRKANRVAYYQGADGRADVSMVITDAQGRTRTREMTILRRDQLDPAAKTDQAKAAAAKKDDYCGDQMFYVHFHRPADVNKMSFLVWKHVKKDDDRWLYMPGLDLVKRISATDKRTSFASSHFYYEDVSGRRITDDTHELTKTTKNYYVLKSTPKDPKLVEFGHFVTWIHRKTFLVVQTEYFDKAGKKYRNYKALAMKKIDGFWTATKSEMADLRTKGKTVLTYANVRYNPGLPESIFSERYLRTAPRKYLK